MLAGGDAGEAASLVEDLYQARAIVTGQGPENRAKGLAECLRDVLVKVSGDPRVPDEPGLSALAEDAASFVAAFRYRDRMEGIPVHDEQGTRDRPYDLTADFHPEKIDEALGALGRDPWTATRPDVLVLVAIRIGGAEFLLTGKGDQGRDQREALTAEADRFGIPVVLPSAEAVSRHGLTIDALRRAEASRLGEVARAMGGDVALSGTLTWSAEALGWISEWRLSFEGRNHSWQKRGGSFDQAFRAALGGAAQILSGNGQPN